jgi:hypothetical protein
MKCHKNIVEPIVLEICQLVRLEEFSNVVEQLLCIKCRQTQDEEDPCDNTDVTTLSARQNFSLPKVCRVTFLYVYVDVVISYLYTGHVLKV